jgi:hypothetical protein
VGTPFLLLSVVSGLAASSELSNSAVLRSQSTRLFSLEVHAQRDADAGYACEEDHDCCIASA